MKNLGNLILLLMVFVGVALVGRGVYMIYNKQKPDVQDPKVIAELKRVDAVDLNTLETGTADEKFIIQSLSRYSNQSGPEAVPMLKKYLNDKRPVVLAAALDAAGAYASPEFSKILSEKLFSPDKVIRIGALGGLSRRSDKDRIDLMKEYWKRIQPDADEALFAKLAELKLSQSESEKTELKKGIVAEVGRAPPDIQVRILEDLYRQMPNDAELIEKARTMLQKKELEKLMPRLLNFEQSYDRDWLKANVIKFPLHDEYEYQLVLIDFLATHCPPGWRAIAMGLKAKKDRQVSLPEIEKANLDKRCN